MSWNDRGIFHGTDKAAPGHGYLAHYERLLSGRGVRSLLEIGVDKGASVATWADVLPPEAAIIGVDIDPACRQYETDRVHIAIADATDRALMDETLGNARFDVIIDDGFHHLDDIDGALAANAHRLADGGLYFIEDSILGRRDWPANTDDVVALLPSHGLRLHERIDAPGWHLVTGDGDFGPFALIVAERA